MLFAVAFSMRKILLLEDDSHYREIIERVLLRLYPCSVRSVATEMQAREEFSRERFDLVLLDLNIDGQKCWDTLKRVALLPDRPVAVVLSCEDTPANAEYAMSLGAFAFLSKPLNFHRLKTTIDSALRRGDEDSAPASQVPPDGSSPVGAS
jgi:DNA-binding NtrC family response regulator